MCALGVGMQFLIGPMATWAAGLAGKIVVFPTLDTGTLMPLLLPRITAIRNGTQETPGLSRPEVSLLMLGQR